MPHRLIPAVGISLLLALAAGGQAPAANPKLQQEYAKLELQLAAQQGPKKAETLAHMAELDFAFADSGYGANQPGTGAQKLDLAAQHADQAVALLSAEPAGKSNGMRKVEISLQKVGYGLTDLARQVHLGERSKVEAVGAHFADLRARVLQLMFAPKSGKVVAPLRVRYQDRDPLTPAESDLVRGTAGQLDRRVPLLLKFAQDRLARFDQIRTATPRPPGRENQLYELLREYKAILPEADNALDDVISGGTTSESSPRKYNVPKVLNATIATVSELLSTLNRIARTSSPADLASYHFMLDDCLDLTNETLQNAQQDRAHSASPSH